MHPFLALPLSRVAFLITFHNYQLINRFWGRERFFFKLQPEVPSFIYFRSLSFTSVFDIEISFPSLLFLFSAKSFSDPIVDFFSSKISG